MPVSGQVSSTGAASYGYPDYHSSSMAVDYSVSWRGVDERLFDVSIRFKAPWDGPRLILPAWRPGRYLIQNFAVNVREWSANMRKVAPSVWAVEARRGDEIEVRYRYWAGVLDAGSSFLDRDEAYFNGSNLFMWVDGLRADEATVSLTAPADWEIETQLDVSSRSAARDDRLCTTTFAARSYDHLIDSPVIAAPSFTRHSFEAEGAVFHLIVVGEPGVDIGQYAEPLRRIAAQQVLVFGSLPLRQYRFLIHVADRWHGVEHEDSCSIVARHDALFAATPGSEGYDHFLSICAHELFHLWNVKRMMPATFAPYDYTVPTPTRLLWLMEGTTSYYGDLSIARAGIWTPEQYLERLEKQIEAVENSPAQAHLSLAQAAFDGWLQEPTRPHDRGNAWFSFYTKGEVVSAVLDLLLRRDGRSLDEVMRSLWTERILDEFAVERAAGDDFSSFFERFVVGTACLPYEEAFAVVGVEYRVKGRAVSHGARLVMSDGVVVVDSVRPGGAAMAAGLLPGDELIALGGLRVRRVSDAEGAVAGKKQGESVDFVSVRAGRLRMGEAPLSDDGAVDVELQIKDRGDRSLHEWLGRKNG
jgi:predicted metalloprotease with PDZ domain